MHGATAAPIAPQSALARALSHPNRLAGLHPPRRTYVNGVKVVELARMEDGSSIALSLEHVRTYSYVYGACV